MKYYCPFCFKKINRDERICPHCKVDILSWEKNTPYDEKLIRALKHPISEVRDGVIITLGNLKSKKAVAPLVKCALKNPANNAQNFEILKSIEKLPFCPEREKAILSLQKHPSRLIREKALQINLPNEKQQSA